MILAKEKKPKNTAFMLLGFRSIETYLFFCYIVGRIRHLTKFALGKLG